jgi:hypothetical protein
MKPMSSKRELILECKRQYENCLYTSTGLFIWLRYLRSIEILLLVVPLVLGFLAGCELLTRSATRWVQVVASICAFLAGLLPVVYAALKFDDRLERCRRLAGEFKNLQDRFRQTALISSHKVFEEFESDFKEIRARLETARAASYTAPDWCFKRAHKKINAGDYAFEVDTDAD